MTEEQIAYRRSYMRNWRKNNPCTGERKKRHLASNRKWNKDNTEYWRMRNREHRENHPEFYRQSEWKRSGIDMSHWSYKQFLIMLEQQNGKCLGCNIGLVATKKEVKEASK